MYLLGLLIVDQLFFSSINTLDFTNNLRVGAFFLPIFFSQNLVKNIKNMIIKKMLK